MSRADTQAPLLTQPRFACAARLGIWAATRVALWGVIYLTFAGYRAATGDEFLTDSPGLAYGLGLPLIMPITIVLSAACWTLVEAAGGFQSNHRRSRVVYWMCLTLLAASVAADAFLYFAQMLLYLPNRGPIVALSVVIALLGGGLLLWLQRPPHRRQRT